MGLSKSDFLLYKEIHTDKLAPGNMKNYLTTIEYTERFLSLYHQGNIFLSQVDMEFATKLEYFIRNNPIKAHDPCKGNGLAKHMQRFKRMMQWSKELKWLPSNPVEDFSAGVKKTKRKKLTIDQVFLMQDTTFADEMIQYVLDLFIFSCYTGLAFADVMALTSSDLEFRENEVVWCSIYRTKSNEPCAVPLLNKAKEIIKKYWDKGNARTGGTIFPRITNAYVNRVLKLFRGFFGILIDLTFHIARHTFAKTIALKHGIPLETVQIMLGHTKIATTQIYADVDEEKVWDDMEGLDQRLEDKKLKSIGNRTLDNTLATV